MLLLREMQMLNIVLRRRKVKLSPAIDDEYCLNYEYYCCAIVQKLISQFPISRNTSKRSCRLLVCKHGIFSRDIVCISKCNILHSFERNGFAAVPRVSALIYTFEQQCRHFSREKFYLLL
jgi:hypothetical protein